MAIPIVDRLTPAQGKVGQQAVAHGDGFKPAGTAAKVEAVFGVSGGTRVSTSVRSDQVAEFIIPNTPANDHDPADPNLVPVSFVVTRADGSWTFGGFYFEAASGTPPTITNPVTKNYNAGSARLDVTVNGANFVSSSGRAPNAAYLTGLGISGTIESYAADGSQVILSYENVPEGSNTAVLIRLSDGTAAKSADFTV